VGGFLGNNMAQDLTISSGGAIGLLGAMVRRRKNRA
jgi:hypothetical protein